MDPLSPPTNWVTHSRWRKAREAIGSSRSRRRIAIIFYAKPLFRRPIIPDLIPVWRQARRSRASSKRPGQKAETRKRHAASTMRRRRSSDDQAGEVDIHDRAKKVEERLRRSEVYLAEAQHLSHTGSFGWTPSTGDFHWSDETFRILEYDSSVKPTLERVLQRVHPDDLATVRQVIDEASRGGKVD